MTNDFNSYHLYFATFIITDLGLRLYFGENCRRRNNGHSNEGWPDCETYVY